MKTICGHCGRPLTTPHASCDFLLAMLRTEPRLKWPLPGEKRCVRRLDTERRSVHANPR